MKKRIFCFVLTFVMMLCVLTPLTALAGSDNYATELRKKGFPETYISKLVELHKKYPKWEFEPLDTGLDFQTAIDKERSRHSKQLIQKTSSNDGKDYYCDCSSCYVNGNYVPQEGRSWVSASRKAVEYYMNPANFLDERYIFQFESTNYNKNQTEAGVEAIIANTWMKDSLITYKDATGATVTYSPETKYSTAIVDAAKNSGMSAYYLASKIVQEVGGKNPTAGGASGTYPGYEGIYNYYNIGANTGVEDGLVWASASSTGYVTNCVCKMRSEPTTNSDIVTKLPKGTPVTYISSTAKQPDGYIWYNVSAKLKGTTYTGYIRSDLVDNNKNDKYNRPWTNPYLSIYNGAKYIAAGFSKTQYTGYLQKFNVNPASGSNMHNHEYMANVQAASAEASNSYKAYSKSGLLSEAKTFVIPVFKSTSGWTTINGDRYYYDENGEFVKGWRRIDNNWYYFNQSGIMQTGWIVLNNKWYYLNNSGIMATGWLEEGGHKYWLDENGVMTIGLKNIDGRMYYFNLSGYMQTGWQTINNQKHYFTETGAMITGWRYIDNIWYWFNNEGIMQTGWQNINGQKYYFNEKGEMLLGWQVMNHKWYYFDNSGAMVKGWLEQGGQKYWLDENGVMAIGFKVIDGEKYFFNSSGVMITGWRYIDNNWYWFESSGIMKTGWKTINNATYYFLAGGDMALGKAEIDGVIYDFGDDGILRGPIK